MATTEITARRFAPAQSLIDAGTANFRQVSAADFCTPAMPAFMLGAIPEKLVSECWVGPGFQWVHEQGVLEIDAAMHAPYLLTRDGVPIEFTWANLHGSYLERIWQPQPETQRRSDVAHVLIAGPGYPIFGHWLVDFLPKLWVLDAAGYDIDAIRYIIPSDTPDFALHLLRLCGLRDIVRLPDGECLRGTFLVPTTIHNGLRGPFLRDAAAFLRMRLGLPARGGSTKLMLSRARAPETRNVGNRPAIERAAEGAGYSVLCPENLSLVEQFRLVGSASAVIGEYGSALHSTLFAGVGTVVAAMRGTGIHPGFVQSAIGSALRQPTGYLFAERQPDDAPEGFTVPDAAFHELLRAVDDRVAFGPSERAARAIWNHYNADGLTACRELARRTIRDIEEFEHERRQHAVALEMSFPADVKHA